MKLYTSNIKDTLYKVPNFWLIFSLALFIRLIYLSLNIPDYWGDAYHSLLISKATVEQGWIYTDYTGRQVVWLPFYRYLAAIPMYLFNSYNLSIPHFLNSIIGSLTCALITLMVSKVAVKKIALFSGALLALLPWHIAYSNINTPEILSGFLILLTIHLWRLKKWMHIIPIVFLGVLTRNEVTLLLSIFGIYLLLIKDWKPAASMLIGGVLGLALWGTWCNSQTGYFFWWITERSIGSTWDHMFQTINGAILGKWYFPFISLIQAFPLLVIILFIPKLLKVKYSQNFQSIKKLLVPLCIVLLFDWVFIFIMQFYFYSYPEPKYFIITLPIACATLGCLFGSSPELLTRKMIRNITILVAIILTIELPIFYFLHIKDNPSKAMGGYVKNHVSQEGNIWIDDTRAWYYSEIEIDRIHSSYTLASRDSRYKNNFQDELRVNLDSLNIKYVIARNSSYTYVFDIWPEMKDNETFEWKELTFSPEYKFVKPNYSHNSINISDWIQSLIIPNDIIAVIWKIEQKKRPKKL